MCLIIFKPKNVVITRGVLRDAYLSYPDGFGFMTGINGELIIKKTSDRNFCQLYKEFRKIESANPNSSFVFHFREATAGFVDETNTHPFYINKNLGFCHNGILPIVPIDKAKSDTVTFNEYVLQNMPADFLSNKAIIWILESLCLRTQNKLVFMNNLGEVKICGEQLGKWDNGLWFSTLYFTGLYTIKNYGFGFNAKDFIHKSDEVILSEDYIIPHYEACIECGEYTENFDGHFEAEGFICDGCSYEKKANLYEGV